MTDLPRVICSDLDGTFLTPDKEVTEANHRAVREAVERGIRVLFATGRPLRNLGLIEHLADVVPTVIASNGAAVVDLTTMTETQRIEIPSAVALELMAAIRQDHPDASFAADLANLLFYEPGYPAPQVTDTAHACDDLAGPMAEHSGTTKLVVRIPDLMLEDANDLVQAIVGDRATVTFSGTPGTVGLLEVGPPDCTKQVRLAELCQQWQVAAEDVACFGDMPNDRTMLAWAGQAYVMEESHRSLADLAAERVGSNADSGVGRTILSWW